MKIIVGMSLLFLFSSPYFFQVYILSYTFAVYWWLSFRNGYHSYPTNCVIRALMVSMTVGHLFKQLNGPSYSGTNHKTPSWSRWIQSVQSHNLNTTPCLHRCIQSDLSVLGILINFQMNLSLSCVCLAHPNLLHSVSLTTSFWRVQITKLVMTQCFSILLSLFICRVPSLPLPNILFANNPNAC